MTNVKKSLKMLGALALCLCLALALLPTAAKADNTMTINISADTLTAAIENMGLKDKFEPSLCAVYTADDSTKDTGMTIVVSSGTPQITQNGYAIRATDTTLSDGIDLKATEGYYVIILLYDATNKLCVTASYSSITSSDGVTYTNITGNQESDYSVTSFSGYQLTLLAPTVTVAASEGGSVSASGYLTANTSAGTYTVKYGNTLTLTATPTTTTASPYYVFGGWYDGNSNSVSSNTEYTTAAITANTEYKAAFNAQYEVTVDTTADSGTEMGTGSVQANGTTISGSSNKVTSGSVTFTFVPDSGSYVSGYKIIGADGTTLEEKENLTESGNKTVTVNVAQDVTVYPAFTLVGSEPTAAANRPAGGLTWSDGKTDDKLTLSYKDALTYNFNAVVTNYILDSQFGKSWKYGVDKLADPSVYISNTLNDSAIGTGNKGTSTDLTTLGQVVTGKTAIQSYNFDMGITASNIAPGTLVQTVYADYYTAKTVCKNHWYHVGGVEYHQDGLSRTITISKDTLSLSVTDGTGDTDGKYDYSTGLTINLALTPASSGDSNSKATVDKDKMTVTVTDADGNTVTEFQNNSYTPTKAGTYTYTITYTGDNYIAAYTADGGTEADTYAPLTVEVTISQGTNPATLTEPTVTKTTATSIVLDSSTIVDDQEYSIDGGKTWITGKDLKSQNSTFSNLTQGTEYTVQTRIPETTQYAAKSSSKSVTTYVTVTGSVTAGGTATPALPATVTLTDADGNKYEVTTDNDGSYSIDVPAGTYSVSVTSESGYQEGTLDSLKVDGTKTVTASTVTMANTTAGDAKVLDDAKTAANSDIADQVAAAKKALDELTDLTDEEKKEYSDAIDKAAKTAQDAVDKATDTDAVKTALEKLETSLGTVATESKAQNIKNKDLADAKADELKDIESDVAAAKKAIDAMDNLTDAEKQAAKDKIDAAAKTAQDAVNAAEDTDAVAAADTALASSLKTIEDDAAAQDLANAKTNATKEIESEAQAAKDAIDKMDNLTDAEKQAAKDAIDAAAKTAKDAVEKATDADGVKKALDALDTSIDATQDDAAAQDAAVQKSADSFVDKYLTQDGKVITEATSATYDTILAGQEDWAKMSQAEKDAVNAALKAAGATQTYDEMLAAVEKTVEESSGDFITKYLTDKDGNIYKEATDSNYSDILSGLTTWNALTQAEKDAINAKLTANGGVSYEELLTKAQELKKSADASSSKTAAPRTSDDAPIALYVVLLSVCAVGLGVTAVTAKKRRAQR